MEEEFPKTFRKEIMGKYSGHNNITALITYETYHYRLKKNQMSRPREAVYKLQLQWKLISQIIINTMIIKTKKLYHTKIALQKGGRQTYSTAGVSG